MKTQKITRVILLKKKRQLLRKFCCLYEENVQWRRPFRSKLVSEGKIRSRVWVRFSDSKLLEKDLKCQTCFLKHCHGPSVLGLIDFFAELAQGFNSCNHQLFGYLWYFIPFLLTIIHLPWWTGTFLSYYSVIIKLLPVPISFVMYSSFCAGIHFYSFF